MIDDYLTEGWDIFILRDTKSDDETAWLKCQQKKVFTLASSAKLLDNDFLQ